MSKRLVCVATGAMWRWWRHPNSNNLLEHLRQLAIDGVELTFANKKSLYSFSLSSLHRRWIRQLSYVSIHAPFKLVAEADGVEDVIRQLGLLKELYHDLRAKTLIIHPNNLPPTNLLEPLDMDISTENLPPNRTVSLAELKKILTARSGMRLCLDVSHAYRVSPHETADLVREFCGRISQVHFSGTYRNRQHGSLQRVSGPFLDSIQPVKQLNCPVVLEEDISMTNMEYLRQEITHLRKLLDT